ncbi:MAG: glycoside hydrolase family 3 C-terminal domain-containing protein [Treponema sp.]|nr:glycoside hydrolase family 3 C-terminal domain-containing protein [Treponema sp.]
MTFGEKILEAACEGIVLLKNERETLPVLKEEKVAVFGRGQINFIKCGLGSGGSVHAPYSTNLIDFMPNADEKLAALYAAFVRENPYDNGGGGWAAEPWNQKEMEVSESLARECAGRNSKAVVVITRNAGEDKDLVKEKGSWFLTDTEWQNIRNICAAFDKVCVVFNACGIVDSSWFDHEDFGGKISAVVYAWQAGQEAGRACARILLGDAVPSGKLSCTIARSIDDYPSTAGFNTGNDSYYIEDIYVGYRYFNTFARDRILYPFGFGLSYTTFDVSFGRASFAGNEVTVRALVRNTGKVAGKETVQVYLSCPQGKLGKPERELAAFIKTGTLLPGQEEAVELSFNIESHASFDDSSATGHRFCRVLEKGRYAVYGGTDSLSAEKISLEDSDCIELAETVVVEKLGSACAPVKAFERIASVAAADGTLSAGNEKVPLREYDMARRITDNLPAEIPQTGDRGIRFLDVKKDSTKLDDFIAQMSDRQLMTLVRGEGMMSRKTTPGIASAMGGLSEELYNLGIPVAGCADGPSGVRLDTGKEANLMPIGTLLACSWNLPLVRELMEYEGEELMENQVDTCLGPGINIQRNPLNGRNFEYFSEDPLLTGAMTVAVITGIQSKGVFPTIKHFAANNREAGRRNNNAIVSERALREIYLVPFEMAVKKGNAASIMTSYNLVNGIQSSSNYDLCQTILREEWKYEGLVMTDWWAIQNDCVSGGESDQNLLSQMVRSRNDVYMIVPNDMAEEDGNGDDLEEALEKGKVTRGELQRCARDVISFMVKAPVSERPLRSLDDVPTFTARMDSVPEGCKAYNEDIKFMKDGTTSVYINVEEDDVYNFLGFYNKANDGTVSQSVCNINIDGENALSLNCRTTEGQSVGAVIGLLKLSKGVYELSIEHTKPGINIEYMGFSRVVTSASAIRFIHEEGEEDDMRARFVRKTPRKKKNS